MALYKYCIIIEMYRPSTDAALKREGPKYSYHNSCNMTHFTLTVRSVYK